MSWTLWALLGSCFSGLAVVLGAFGAHFLKARLSPDMLEIFEVGVRYQMYHGLALLAMGMLATRIDHMGLKVAGVAFVIGILIFSGSLYILVFSGQRFWGAITPVGGVGLIVGWLALTITFIRLR